MRGHVLVVDDVTTAALDLWARVLHEAGRGRVSVALSGGSTPLEMFERLGSPALASPWRWEQLVLFWGDERPVPPDHPDSNYGAARVRWLDRVPVPPDQIHPWPTELAPEEAARQYAATLTAALGPEPVFDLVWLGVGPEGHTASLFPGSPALSAPALAAAPFVAAKDTMRLTLTPQVFNRSRRIVFLARGEDKRDIVQRAFSDPDAGLPVQAIQPAADPWWILDRAAAAGLPAFPRGRPAVANG